MTSPFSPARVAVSETFRFVKMFEVRSDYHTRYVLGRPARQKTQKFFEAALESDTHECVIWPFSTDKDGYAKMRYDGASSIVSRLVCEFVHGIAPSDSHQAAHACATPSCINPKHLRWATPAENAADKTGQGTNQIGEKNSCAKLTEADVRSIRSLAERGCSGRKIAAQFGINKSTAWQIVARKKWRHVA